MKTYYIGIRYSMIVCIIIITLCSCSSHCPNIEQPTYVYNGMQLYRIGQLGSDFDSSLDSLISSEEILRNAGNSLIIRKDTLKDLQTTDNSIIIALLFCQDFYPNILYSMSDAIGTNGYYYRIYMPND